MAVFSLERSQIDLERQWRLGSINIVCAGFLLSLGIRKMQFLHLFILLKTLTVSRRIKTCFCSLVISLLTFSYF